LCGRLRDVDIHLIADRTTTIRASVTDVGLALAFTVVLVSLSVWRFRKQLG